MQANVTLTNSSEFCLNNEEVFLRDIPTSINVGNLSVDSLRLLVFYVAKAGPYKLAVESGFFTGTLEEWLISLYGSGEGAGRPGPAGPKGEDGVDGIDGVTQDATTITFTGLSLDDSTPVTETDTLLAVIGKLQAQITALEARLDARVETLA